MAGAGLCRAAVKCRRTARNGNGSASVRACARGSSLACAAGLGRNRVAGIRRRIGASRECVVEREDRVALLLDAEPAEIHHARLRQVRTGLQSILELLSTDSENQGELRLVAASASAPKKKTAGKVKSKK